MNLLVRLTHCGQRRLREAQPWRHILKLLSNHILIEAGLARPQARRHPVPPWQREGGDECDLLELRSWRARFLRQNSGASGASPQP